MIFSWGQICILICSGILVGFINTLAGGGTVISISTFMFMGLPPIVANGTNRIAIFFQNIVAVYFFNKKKLIDWQRIIKVSVAVIVGSLLGAALAGKMSDTLFKYLFAIVIVLFGLSMIFNSKRWIKEKPEMQHQKMAWWKYLIFLVIGIYSGFIHVGCGYLFLAALVLLNGNELLKANAMKNTIVLLYIPFSLMVFAFQGNVCWTMGLIHSIGNMIGAAVAAKFALKSGQNVVKYILLALIVVVVLQLFGVITPESITSLFTKK